MTTIERSHPPSSAVKQQGVRVQLSNTVCFTAEATRCWGIRFFSALAAWISGAIGRCFEWIWKCCCVSSKSKESPLPSVPQPQKPPPVIEVPTISISVNSPSPSPTPLPPTPSDVSEALTTTPISPSSPPLHLTDLLVAPPAGLLKPIPIQLVSHAELDFFEEGFVIVDSEPVPLQFDDPEEMVEVPLPKLPQLKCAQEDNYQKSHAELITLGKEIAEGRFPQENRLQHIAGFNWYLRDLAFRKKNVQFEEGMFLIQDPEHKIYTFLNKTPGAYQRASSHFKRDRLSSWGIDIPQDGVNGLPCGHRTVHFGHIMKNGQRYLFLKPEKWGCDPRDLYSFFMHGLDYLCTRISHLQGNPGRENDQKEHVPNELVEQFARLCGEIKLVFDRTAVQMKGIQKMAEILTNYLNTANEKTIKYQQALDFLNQIGRQYSNIEIRSGKEIIFTSLK